MNNKIDNIRKLKKSTLFPDQFIDSYKIDYEELIKKEEIEIKKNILELERKGCSLAFIHEYIKTKYDSLSED